MIDKLVKITFPLLFVPLVLLSPCYAQNNGSITLSQQMIHVSILNRQKESTYRIFLFTSNSEHISAKREGKVFRSGDEIRLKNKGTVVIEDIPVGVNYRILQSEPHYAFEDRERIYEGIITNENENIKITFTDTETDGSIYVFPEVYTRIGNTNEMFKETAYTIEALDALPEGIELPSQPIRFRGSGPCIFPAIKFTNEVSNLRLQITPVDLKDGYIYEKERTLMTVSIGGSETFEPKISYEKNNVITDKPPEYQVLKPDPVSLYPRARKSIKGKYPHQKPFRMILEADPNYLKGMLLPDVRTLDILPESEGVFSPIHFTQTGKFQFRIREESGKIPGIGYDPSVFTETVTVGIKDNDLEITEINMKQDGLEVFNEQARFVNTYHSGDLKIRKQVMGKVSDESFEFRIRFYNESEEETSRYPCSGGSHETIGSGDTFFLKDGEELLIRSLPKDLKYCIQETGLPKGYTNKIENGYGRIKENETLTVTCLNTYKPEKTSFIPTLRKEINGDQPATEETFEFEITTSESQDTLPENTKVYINGIGQASFEPIVFEAPGTYQYRINEHKREIPGYQFDETVWSLNIEVQDIDAELSVTKAQYLSQQRSEIEAAVFTNTFTLNPTFLSLPVVKAFSGTEPVYQRDYQFYLEGDPGNPDGSEIGEQLLKYSLDQPEAQSFSPVTFRKPGSFTYTVREISQNETGMTYDQSVFTVKVEVIQEGANLRADYQILKEEEIQEELRFVNNYRVSDLAFTKKISGYSIPGQEYTFKITLNHPEREEYSYPVEYQKGEEKKSLNSGETFKLRDSENIIFKDLPQGLEYSIQELEIPLSYQPEEEIKTGKIGTVNNIVFLNTYQVEPVSVEPSVTKQIHGDYTRVSKPFRFVLEPTEIRPFDPVENEQELIITGAGTGNFSQITYTVPGVYVYSLKEINSGYKGYSYDERVYQYSVEISDTGGRLEAKESISLSGESKESIVFNNRYRPLPAEYAPTVSKEIIGSPYNNCDFVFKLSQIQRNRGAVLPENTELLISGTGTGNFEAIIFNHAGVYLFEIHEISGSVPGYEYDASVFRLEVTVTDVDGQLQVTRADYRKNDEMKEELTRSVYKEPVAFSVPQKNEVKTLKLKGTAPENWSEPVSYPVYPVHYIPRFRNVFHSGDLEIKKSVMGEGTDRSFKFKVSLTDGSNILNQSFSSKGSSGPVFKNPGYIEIHDQETVRILSIPAGTHYRVEEDLPPEYTNETINGRGVIQDKTVSRCEVINTPVEINLDSIQKKKYDLPKTGRKINLLISALGIAVSAALFFLTLHQFKYLSLGDFKEKIMILPDGFLKWIRRKNGNDT